MKIVEPSVELLWITPQAEKMIELAGRTAYKSSPRVFKDCNTCYGSGLIVENISSGDDYPNRNISLSCPTCSERSTREFIQRILKSNHTSVIEHASASFRVITDRGISHEAIRSRIGVSYTQESSRYCNYFSDKFGNEITVIKPSQLKEENFNDWKQSMEFCEKTYFKLIDSGVSPQNARSVLPTCLKTEIVMTFTFRAWIHFLELRLDTAAHPDIQLIAHKIKDQLKKESPNVFANFN